MPDFNPHRRNQPPKSLWPKKHPKEEKHPKLPINKKLLDDLKEAFHHPKDLSAGRIAQLKEELRALEYKEREMPAKFHEYFLKCVNLFHNALEPHSLFLKSKEPVFLIGWSNSKTTYPKIFSTIKNFSLFSVFKRSLRILFYFSEKIHDYLEEKMNQVVTPIQPTIVAPVVKTSVWGGQGSRDLQEGIETGNVEQVLDAVKVQGVSVHASLPNGELPLCFADKLDLPDMAQKLMKMGAKPGQKDSHGYNAIEHAAFLKKEKVLPCLLRAVAQTEVDAVNQEYPGMAGSTQMKLLRQHCFNLAQRQPSMLYSSICKAAYNGDLDALRAFDGDVDAPDWNGLTPVHYALLGKGGLAALDILMSKGANVHFVTTSKETYLHFAALSGKPECVAKLCEHGLKVTKANAANQFPLHYAMVLTDYSWEYGYAG